MISQCNLKVHLLGEETQQLGSKRCENSRSYTYWYSGFRVYWDYVGIMENEMETTIQGLGEIGGYIKANKLRAEESNTRHYSNVVEYIRLAIRETLENEIETGILKWFMGVRFQKTRLIIAYGGS